MLRAATSVFAAHLFVLIPVSAFAATAGAEVLLGHDVGAESIDIDLRFNNPQFIDNQALLSIDSAAELTALFALAPVASPTVTLFFVDSVNWCAGSMPTAVGCASGSTIVRQSGTAAGGNGSELLAHELGHVHGLPHLEVPTTNIMNCCDWGNTTFTEAQLSDINGSAFVQDDSGTQFTTITQVLITPEPGRTLALSLFGLTVVSWRARATHRRQPRRGQSPG